MADRYYTDELTAVPFRLLVRCMSNSVPSRLAYSLAVYFVCRRFLKWPLPANYATGELGSERVVEYGELPARAASRWAPLMEQFSDAGFRPLRFSIGDVIGSKEHVVGLFLDATGMTILTLEWLSIGGATGIQERTPYELNSYASSDPEVLTGVVDEESRGFADMLQLEFVDLQILSNRQSVSQVYAHHQNRLTGRSFFRMDPQAALQEHLKRRQRRFEWSLNRGLLREVTAAEVARLRQSYD